ncbi:MAG: 5,10-methylenetetrahydrofolate reductase [Deltaproteobacteria bacterium RBG_13_43_22]|nr:MAG: 5,10-methylenetetrahydrofolate reductase [Deltaproteobacteria bacterium RBG_13_43_22]
MGLKDKIEAGEFTILAEMEPPKGVDVSVMLSNAKRVKDGVDAFVIPEMGNAVMRMSSLGGAMVLQNEGLPTVFQVCCRDRNRLAIQGDLLAAHALGINTVMAVIGEDPSFGDHHQARSVNDVDLFELIKAIDRLNQGKDMAGIELAGAPDFLIGSTTEAGAKGKSTEVEMEEMMKRVEAGARFLITSPIFDPSLLDPYKKRIDLRKVAVIPTVMLLKSLGMARYLVRNLPHLHISETIIDRIARAPDKVRECVQIATETVRELKHQGFNGVYLSTLGWENKLPEIIEGI